MTNTVVSINVLHYNTFEKTKNCIESCLAQKGVDYEIILIDNNSTDGSTKALKELFADRILVLENEENFGFAKGNNIGIQYSHERGNRYCLMLNSDIVLHGEYLLKDLISVMQNNPNCGIVAPYIYDVTAKGLVLNQNDSTYLRLLRRAGILPKCRRISENLVQVSEAQGSVLLVDNDCFLTIGGFPEHYYMYGEEGCFAKKALWAGKDILWYQNDESYALHYHDKSGKVDPWRLYLMGRNRMLEYYENKHRRPILWPVIFSLFLLSRKLKSVDPAYLHGVQRAKKMICEKASAEDFYEDGKSARTRQNG